jgi:hypothetical protein
MNNEVHALIAQVTQLCADKGLIGFIGAFRSVEGYHCFYVEHPDHADGELETLQGQLQEAIDATGNTERVCVQDGLIKVAASNPPSGEMPT